ncbi:DUF4396 domain-containing protein [Streptomyces sp. NPDC001985]|uniref:DUF4396 domain-containing protein n=1 Tax=Streptomyces sp. NPDC001985 TaxID=3154406 RepID=UPI0033311888
MDHGAHSRPTDHGHDGHDRHNGRDGRDGHRRPEGPGQRADHARHQHPGNGGASWGMAVRATLHCLVGCAIGEVLGMAIGTALGWHNVPTMALAIFLAFVFGYSFTMVTILRAGIGFRTAVKIALAADTLSITVMEITDNSVLALWPGALHAELSDALFWYALAIAFAVAFVITTPVNKWLIGRGRGHAVMHRFH